MNYLWRKHGCERATLLFSSDADTTDVYFPFLNISDLTVFMWSSINFIFYVASLQCAINYSVMNSIYEFSKITNLLLCYGFSSFYAEFYKMKNNFSSSLKFKSLQQSAEFPQESKLKMKRKLFSESVTTFFLYSSQN